MNEQPTVATQPEITTNKNRKGLRIFTVVLLVLLLLGSVGYAVYAWQQNQTLSSNLASQKDTTSDLERQLSTLKGSHTTDSEDTVGNVIAIRELGVSITVPDSIKDLTYSYSSHGTGSNKREVVSFSTQALTDKYAATNECTSYGSAPPLGGLSKVAGEYPTEANVGNAPGPLAKQFASYYIAYTGPQAVCVSSQTTSLAELSDFKNSLSTIKEL